MGEADGRLEEPEGILGEAIGRGWLPMGSSGEVMGKVGLQSGDRPEPPVSIGVTAVVTRDEVAASRSVMPCDCGPGRLDSE